MAYLQKKCIVLMARQPSARLFSTSGVLNGTVKTKLHHAVKSYDDYGLTKKEYMIKEEKEKKKALKTRMKPLNPQKYNQIMESSGVSDPDSQLDSTIPVLRQSSHRMLYNFLGTSGNQIQDSYVVAEDVLKFLKTGADVKALLLCKLAKGNGVVGMNHILEYYTNRQHLSVAIKSMNYRKKWNIPCNEQTFTILFRGCADSKRPLSRTTSDKIYEIYQNLQKNYRERAKDNDKETIELSEYHINTVLKALNNCSSNNNAWDIFESLPSSGPHSASNITFSIMFEGTRNIGKQEEKNQKVNRMLDLIVNKYLESLDLGGNAIRFKIDTKLLSAMVGAVSRTDDIVVQLKALKVIQHFVSLGKYQFEEILPFEKLTVEEGSSLDRLLQNPKSSKLIPTRKLLTLILVLSRSMETVDWNTVFDRIISVNPLAMDRVLLSTWITYKKTELEPLTMANDLKDELLKLRRDLAKYLGEHDERTVEFLHDLFIGKDSFALTNVCEAYNEQALATKEIYSDALIPEEEEEKRAFLEKKYYSNRALFNSISELLENKLAFSGIDPSQDMKWFKKYLFTLYNVELNERESKLVMKKYLRFINTVDLDRDCIEGHQISPIKLDTLKLIFVYMSRVCQDLVDFIKADRESRRPRSVWRNIGRKTEGRIFFTHKKLLVDYVKLIGTMQRRRD
ncbi:Mrx1 protein [Saccharomycopsis crataegensis]|uniref:Mrx1 protein n=1 Tax=Saccharomycopsis crataegensis TaxID=43959 RepID=A0AAV5QF90_9ASCO|nr:Mrx1 protein [Saccharomycopsis crataegensis]